MRSILFGLLLVGVYLGNRQASSALDDTFPNQSYPYVWLRGYGPHLDHFRWYLIPPGGHLPDHSTNVRGHIISRYPLATPIISVPLIWPQLWYLDHFRPRWESTPLGLLDSCGQMTKNAMAVLTALAAVLLLQTLDRLGLRRVAVPTAFAAALGSDLWAVASQSGWAHGPAALALAAMLRLLAPGPTSRLRLAGAGLAAGALVAIRLLEVVFPAAVVFWLLRSRPRDMAWFVLPAVPIVAALLTYNYWFFGTWQGGQAQLEALHPSIHKVQGVWTGDLIEGAAGTLFSPSRGLFVYVPWAALGLLTLPATARRIAAFPAVAWMLAALVPFGLMLSKYSVWWAGHSFGPRYWTEATVLLAVPLGFSLDWCWLRCRPLLIPFALAIAWSICLQAIGAFCYPSSWNFDPANIDRNHERLWDWRDTEITRCLREGRKPWHPVH